MLDFTITTLNLISPLLGLTGSALLFRFGIPYRIRTDGMRFFVDSEVEEATKKLNSLFGLIGTIGVVLIGCRFLLQFGGIDFALWGDSR